MVDPYFSHAKFEILRWWIPVFRMQNSKFFHGGSLFFACEIRKFAMVEPPHPHKILESKTLQNSAKLSKTFAKLHKIEENLRHRKSFARFRLETLSIITAQTGQTPKFPHCLRFSSIL